MDYRAIEGGRVCSLALILATGLWAGAAATEPRPVILVGGNPFEFGARSGATVRVNPVTGHPAIACNGLPGSVLYFEWDGNRWSGEKVAAGSVNKGSLTFDPVSGEPIIGFRSDAPGVHLALRDRGVWRTETTDTEWQVRTRVQALAPPTTRTLYLVYNAVLAGETENKPTLRYAKRIGENHYQFGLVDEGPVFSAGEFFSAALDPETLLPSVAYSGADWPQANAFVRFAEMTPEGWVVDPVRTGISSTVDLVYAARDQSIEPLIAAPQSALYGYLYKADGVWTQGGTPTIQGYTGFLSHPTTHRPVVIRRNPTEVWSVTLEPTTQTLERVGVPHAEQEYAFSADGRLHGVGVDIPTGSLNGTLTSIESGDGAWTERLLIGDWSRPGLSARAAFAPMSSVLWSTWTEERSKGLFVERWEKGRAEIEKIAEGGVRPELHFAPSATKPHVFYSDGDLRVAVPSGDGYIHEKVAEGVDYASGAIDPSSGIICAAWGTSPIRFTRRAGPGSYPVENLGLGTFGIFPRQLLIDASGTPSIVGIMDGSIYRVVKSGSSWSASQVARADASYGYVDPSAVLYPASNEFAFCATKRVTDAVEGNRRDIAFRGWTGTANVAEETVYSAPGSPFLASRLAVDPARNRPVILFFAGDNLGTTGTLSLARRDATDWTVETLSTTIRCQYHPDTYSQVAYLDAAFSDSGESAFVAYDADTQALLGWLSPALLPLFQGVFFGIR